MWRRPLRGFAFPGLLVREVALIAGVVRPVAYMVWPPTTPRWGELVEEGGEGVRRPRREESAGGTGLRWVFAIFGEVLLVGACFVW